MQKLSFASSPFFPSKVHIHLYLRLSLPNLFPFHCHLMYNSPSGKNWLSRVWENIPKERIIVFHRINESTCYIHQTKLLWQKPQLLKYSFHLLHAFFYYSQIGWDIHATRKIYRHTSPRHLLHIIYYILPSTIFTPSSTLMTYALPPARAIASATFSACCGA